MSDDKFCSECGAPLKEGFSFCSECGKKVRKIDSFNKRHLILAVVGLFSLTLMIIGLSMMFMTQEYENQIFSGFSMDVPKDSIISYDGIDAETLSSETIWSTDDDSIVIRKVDFIALVTMYEVKGALIRAGAIEIDSGVPDVFAFKIAYDPDGVAFVKITSKGYVAIVVDDQDVGRHMIQSFQEI